MPVTDFRQRTAMLFIAVVLGHIILISAQVNSSAGVPLLEVVTFGAFAEVQRGAAGLTGGIRDAWSGYGNLRHVRAENEELRRKLGELQAWISGIRRDQTLNRASAHKIEWDSKFGLVKINPIVDWDSKKVWRYIHKHNVPYNPLHDQGYPSIGCTHCTRAIGPGEDPRAGRWSGFSKNECGLHLIEPAPPVPDPKTSASGACD